MNLRLISCNIRFDNPADGVNAWPHRREFLASTLLSHSPDIIATQEGRYAQLKDLASLLPDFELLDLHRSWIKERMYPSFFLRKEKFEIVKSEDLWLSETPEIAGSRSFGSTFPRLMTWVRLQPKDLKQNLLLVNTHLDHIQEATRIAQSQVLVKEVKKVLHPTDSLVFMGDFNDSPESSTRKIITESFPLQDAWKKFHDHEETSHHAFAGEMQNGSRIDWILVDQRLEVLNAEMNKTKTNGHYPTDHFPVIAEIRI